MSEPQRTGAAGSRRRAGLLVALMLAGAVVAGVARAQDEEGDEPPPPTFTVMTRPAGATVKLRGPQRIAGAGPLTIERPAPGRTRVSVSAPGYETWRRTLALDGAGADSVWASLAQKHAFKGAARSLLVPGWGQIYDEHRGHAWTFAIAAATAGTGLLVSHLQFLDKQDIYDERLARLSLPGQDTPSNRRIAREAYEGAQDARDTRQRFAAIGAGIWALNVVDALVFGPPHPRAPRAGIETSASWSDDGLRVACAIRWTP